MIDGHCGDIVAVDLDPLYEQDLCKGGAHLLRKGKIRQDKSVKLGQITVYMSLKHLGGNETFHPVTVVFVDLGHLVTGSHHSCIEISGSLPLQRAFVGKVQVHHLGDGIFLVKIQGIHIVLVKFCDP